MSLPGIDSSAWASGLPLDPYAQLGLSMQRAMAKHFNPKAHEWKDDPEAWARDRLRVHMWSKQVEIAASVRDNSYTAVPSCHGPGKSFNAALITCWWLDTHAPGTAFVITTAPTMRQVKAILWREITRMHKRAGEGTLRGKLNQTEWWEDGEQIAIGAKPSDTDAAAFQGIHSENILVIIDEAGGVPKQIWTAAIDIATNDGARILAIGNPDDATSEFKAVCDSPLWNVIRISAFETPNLTGEPVPAELRKNLVNRRWVEERAQDWGEDNPLYISKVLALFPVDTADGVVRASDAMKCMNAHDGLYTPSQLLPVELGVDVGGSDNGDETVVRERRGMVAGREWRIRSADPEVVVDFIWMAIGEVNPTAVKVDAIGVGWGIVGSLRTRARAERRQLGVVDVRVGMASKQPEKYMKLKDEVWWEVGRMNSQNRAWDLSRMENKEDTVAQLCMPKFTLVNGKIKVESKDDLRKRMGRSPDSADALLLAYWVGSGGPASISSASDQRIVTGASAGQRSGGRMLGNAALAGRTGGRITR